MRNMDLLRTLMRILCLCACGTSKKGVSSEMTAVDITFNADSA